MNELEVYLHIAPFIALDEERLRRWDEICDEMDFESTCLGNWFETGEEAVQDMKSLKEWYSGLSESQSMWVWHRKVAGLNVVITTLPEHCDSDDSSNLSKIEGFPKLYQWIEWEAHEDESDEDGETGFVIDEDLAQAFLDDTDNVDLSEATEISVEAAKLLSASEGDLILNGITHLPDEVAWAFSSHQGDTIELNGVTHLSEAAAESFSRHQGVLRLNGLIDLPEAVASSLAKQKGIVGEDLICWGLELDGLTELSDSAAESLSHYEGVELSLTGLTELSESVAESLARYECGLQGEHGNLWLSGLAEFSDAAAEGLSRHQGGLWLPWPRISDAAIELLSGKRGNISGKDPKKWAERLRMRMTNGLV